MNVLIFSLFAFVSTILGGLTSIKLNKKIHIVLGFTAGVIFGLIVFDILPEIFELTSELNISDKIPMLILVLGFMVFHVLEKFLMVHHGQEEHYGAHNHLVTGKFSAIAIAAHSFMDGIGIGLGFQVSNMIGITIAITIIGHRFADGFNTGAMLLSHDKDYKKAFNYIFLVSITPFLGAISTYFFEVSEKFLLYFLAFFAGSLLYICLEDILPEAHSKNNSLKPLVSTILGLSFIFFITLFV